MTVLVNRSSGGGGDVLSSFQGVFTLCPILACTVCENSKCTEPRLSKEVVEQKFAYIFAYSNTQNEL